MALENILGSMAGAAVGGYFDKQAAEKVGAGNIAATNLTIADAQRSRDEARRSFVGDTPTQRTTQRPDELGGGFKAEHLGPQLDLFKGDEPRALATNVITANPTQTFPTLQDAIANAEIGTAQQRRIAQEQVIDPFLKLKKRQFGGINNTGLPGAIGNNPELNKLIANLPTAQDVGLKDFERLRKSDTDFDLANLNIQSPKAATLTLPGAAASAIPGQIPLAPRSAAGGEVAAAGDAAISNAISQMLAANAADHASIKADERIRFLAEQGLFS